MTGINWRSFIVGGLVAGVIINISAITLVHGVFGEAYAATFVSHLSSEITIPTAALLIWVRLVVGMVVTFVYIGFRPRFGPGPRTALIACLAVWFSTYITLAFMLNKFGVLTGWRLWVTIVWGFGEVYVATLVGAWIYREQPAASSEERSESMAPVKHPPHSSSWRVSGESSGGK